MRKVYLPKSRAAHSPIPNLVQNIFFRNSSVDTLIDALESGSFVQQRLMPSVADGTEGTNMCMACRSSPSAVLAAVRRLLLRHVVRFVVRDLNFNLLVPCWFSDRFVVGFVCLEYL